jgi:short-chain dehydrogenase/reductase SDR
LEKQVTIVFGATGKVGADTCRALSRMGHTVVVHYFHSRAKAESIVADIERSGGSAMALQADVREENQTCALVRAVVERYGAVHTVVNFVHRDDYAPTEVADMTWEDWGCHLDAVKSYFCICKAVLPVMKQQQYGRIIYISGGLAYRFFKGCAPYSAVKAGMNAFSKSLAGEVGKDHITVNVIAPGKVVCRGDEAQERFSEDAVSKCPLGKFTSPEDIAGAIAFYSSSMAENVTGQTIYVSGGEIMPMP